MEHIRIDNRLAPGSTGLYLGYTRPDFAIRRHRTLMGYGVFRDGIGHCTVLLQKQCCVGHAFTLSSLGLDLTPFMTGAGNLSQRSADFQVLLTTGSYAHLSSVPLEQYRVVGSAWAYPDFIECYLDIALVGSGLLQLVLDPLSDASSAVQSRFSIH